MKTQLPNGDEPQPPVLTMASGKLIGLAAAAVIFIFLILAWSLGMFGGSAEEPNKEVPAMGAPAPAPSAPLGDPRG